jgi:hypothetical protein
MVMCNHPWDTDTGGILAPGDVADVDDTERVREAISDGLLREVTEPSPPAPPAPSDKPVEAEPEPARSTRSSKGGQS